MIRDSRSIAQVKSMKALNSAVVCVDAGRLLGWDPGDPPMDGWRQ